MTSKEEGATSHPAPDASGPSATRKRERPKTGVSTQPQPAGIASYVSEEIIAELAWNRDTAAPDFIIYDRHAHTVTRNTVVGTSEGQQTIPKCAKGIVTPGGNVSGSVLVPTEADLALLETAGENGLHADVHAFIHRYVELPGDSEALAVEYVFLTWVFDCFDELPYLAFRTADCGRGKSRALETVGSLCYRPLIVGGGSSSAAVLRMLNDLGGTLVCDEFDRCSNTELGSDLAKILNQGFQRRRPLVKCTGEDNTPKPFGCFGPKVFALRQGLGDDATESRTISIRMGRRTREDIMLNLPREQFDREALALRNRLLVWRFRHLGCTELNRTLQDRTLDDRVNQIGLPLLSVARDDATRWRIIGTLRDQQRNLALDRRHTLVGEVYAAMVALCRPGATVRPGKVAAELNRRRAKQRGISERRLDATEKLTSQKVGRILRFELELPPDTTGRDAASVRYTLDPGRLELLRRRFGGVPPESTQTTDIARRRRKCVSAHRRKRAKTKSPSSRVDRADCVVSRGPARRGRGRMSPNRGGGGARRVLRGRKS